jgi:hypothetical protein
MKSRCPAEQLAARLARDALLRLLERDSVSVSNIAGAKFYGRVLADVTTSDGGQVAVALTAEKLVRDYSEGKRKGLVLNPCHEKGRRFHRSRRPFRVSVRGAAVSRDRGITGRTSCRQRRGCSPPRQSAEATLWKTKSLDIGSPPFNSLNTAPKVGYFGP